NRTATTALIWCCGKVICRDNKKTILVRQIDRNQENNTVWLKLDKEYRSAAGHSYPTWSGKEGVD
ncbi:MAG TPA: hypothetical protein VII97_02510, partial [Anaerolineales bacterium]